MRSSMLLHYALLSFILFIGLTACSSLDRMNTKLDMAAGHWSEPGRPIAEGRIQELRRVHAMTAIELTDGTLYDVADAPAGLVAGDVIRIYKTANGLEAHLWRAVDNKSFAEVEQTPTRS